MKVQVRFKLSPEERVALRTEAARHDLPLAEWCRGVLLREAGWNGLASQRRRPRSVSVQRGAPDCEHVPVGGFCGRCGGWRP